MKIDQNLAKKSISIEFEVISIRTHNNSYNINPQPEDDSIKMLTPIPAFYKIQDQYQQHTNFELNADINLSKLHFSIANTNNCFASMPILASIPKCIANTTG